MSAHSRHVPRACAKCGGHVRHMAENAAGVHYRCSECKEGGALAKDDRGRYTGWTGPVFTWGAE